ncbi:uncharacterized protein LOC117294605 [Asterias rubens]|uniref:Arnp11 n=1 Tax=Asterias rubens TaxID=7604 RepID=A0A0U2NKC5_ASTRU|nr:uncharacterized protein LOC117294605 [Asterias rubens]ALJ99976.1 Arnp11 [Asterias rubens]
MRTALVTFLAMLLVGDLIVSALPIDNEQDSDPIFDHLYTRNIVERRSRKDLTKCISECVSCAKYAGLYADKCVRGCSSKTSGKGIINKTEFDAWSACEQFLHR